MTVVVGYCSPLSLRREHIPPHHHRPLLGNQTQMVPGTDTGRLFFAFCESDAVISSQEVRCGPTRPRRGEERLRKGKTGGGVTGVKLSSLNSFN